MSVRLSVSFCPLNIIFRQFFVSLCNLYYTVKRVDEVVRHPHLVTQDQFTQVSKKVFDIPVENFTINIELFRHFSQVWN
jgi:hypothetical protein